jgi:hypothetical protein
VLPKLRINFRIFGRTKLTGVLGLQKPPLVSRDVVYRQLDYVEKYAGAHGCKSLLVEGHYIDRDYMEDYSVFYSRSLVPYRNWCQRVHFFKLSRSELKRAFDKIVMTGLRKGKDEYRQACREFSNENYLGFVVIKSLPGCPVGRTVLRCYPGEAGNGLRRRFECTREYVVHVAGVELTVQGLAFQQQDEGVSACATTALWAALQKFKEFEELGRATPAQITILAARSELPFGRPMPSEGLSIGQMCQAVQALGVSPSLVRAKKFEVTRDIIFSAVASGFSPVLVLTGWPVVERNHAVAVAGMEVRRRDRPSPMAPETHMDDRESDLVALYVHDDRYGPYLRATVAQEEEEFQLHFGPKRAPERWIVSHILIPMHSKIRLSFAGLWKCAAGATTVVHAHREAYLGTATLSGTYAKYVLLSDTWFARAHIYVENLFLSNKPAGAEIAKKLSKTVPLSRYVAVVRIRAPYLGILELLFDSTSTPRNIQCLCVVAVKKLTKNMLPTLRHLAKVYSCEIIA